MNKQLTMSLISDELAQATTRKKEFLGIMEKLVPWTEYYEDFVRKHPKWELVEIYAETYHPIMRQCTRSGCTFLCTGCI